MCTVSLQPKTANALIEDMPQSCCKMGSGVPTDLHDMQPFSYAFMLTKDACLAALLVNFQLDE